MSPLDLIWGIVLLLDFRRRTYWGMSTHYWKCFVVCHPSTENVAIHQNLRVLHLCWYDDLSSWLYKSQQVNLSSQLDKTCQVITCQVIRRGARGQNDKSTCQVNMTSWLVCRVELVTYKKNCRRQLAKKNWGSLARRSRCLRDFPVIFWRVLVYLKWVFFGWTRCEIWPWHDPPPTSFPQYKQSRTFCSQGQQS